MKGRSDGSRRGVFLSVSVVSAAALMLAVQGMADAFLSQPSFLVREVEVVWPEGSSALPSRFRLHPPTSVFRVDLESLAHAFQRRFPLSEVERIERVLPNRLRATMKARRVVAQVRADKRYFPISDEGVVVAAGRPAPWEGVPVVELDPSPRSIRPGARVGGPAFSRCSELLSAIRRDGGIAGHSVRGVRVSREEIRVRLDTGVEIRFSGDQIWSQWQRLADLVSRKRQVLEEANYVDLRFEHPVISEKPPKTSSSRKRGSKVPFLIPAFAGMTRWL